MFSIVGTPTIFANDIQDGGTAWTNPTQAADTSGNGAEVTLAAGASSQWLKCTGCNLVIPDGGSVKGNEPSLEQSASAVALVQVNNSRLVKSGVIGSIEAVTLPLVSTLSFVAVTLAGQTTLLAASVAVSEVIVSGYGVAVRAMNIGLLSATIFVRKVRLTVYYTLPIIHPMTGIAVG